VTLLANKQQAARQGHIAAAACKQQPQQQLASGDVLFVVTNCRQAAS